MTLCFFNDNVCLFFPLTMLVCGFQWCPAGLWFSMMSCWFVVFNDAAFVFPHDLMLLCGFQWHCAHVSSWPHVALWFSMVLCSCFLHKDNDLPCCSEDGILLVCGFQWHHWAPIRVFHLSSSIFNLTTKSSHVSAPALRAASIRLTHRPHMWTPVTLQSNERTRWANERGSSWLRRKRQIANCLLTLTNH